ncbi:MAG: hypothetical protein LIO94_10650 [Clostridiales bacterium]|nr:hypothetical protein [Clostridiales bacterium]
MSEEMSTVWANKSFVPGRIFLFTNPKQQQKEKAGCADLSAKDCIFLLGWAGRPSSLRHMLSWTAYSLQGRRSVACCFHQSQTAAKEK